MVGAGWTKGAPTDDEWLCLCGLPIVVGIIIKKCALTLCSPPCNRLVLRAGNTTAVDPAALSRRNSADKSRAMCIRRPPRDTCPKSVPHMRRKLSIPSKGEGGD